MKNVLPPYDVVVCGGGFAGLGAAFALSEKKLKVLVLEPSPSLGGEITRSYNLDIIAGISQLADELCGRIEKAGGKKGIRIDAVIAELCLLKMIEDRFDVLHYCHPVGIISDKERISGVVAAGKSGQFAIPSRTVIDATGNFLMLKYSGIEIPESKPAARIFSFFMNGVENRESLPEKIHYGKNSFLLKKSIWDGEVAVEFISNSSKPCHARLMIPGILELIRKEFPQMKKAVMSHAAISELQLPELNREKFSGLEKCSCIFPALIPGSQSFSLEERGNLIPELILSGEKAAELLTLETDMKTKLPDLNEVPVCAIFAAPEIKKDIIVCGGGTAGAVAAISSAREGVKTLLIEASCGLGGVGTGGAINSYYYGAKGGIQDDIDAQVELISPLFMGAGVLLTDGFNPELKKIILQNMLLDAGGEILFECTVCGVETELAQSSLPSRSGEKALRKIKSVVIAGPSGCTSYSGNVFVDSTGDGDLAAMAGAEFIFGRVSDGLPHTYTQASSVIKKDDEGNVILTRNNFDAGYCDPTDPRDLTRARITGLKHYWREKFDDQARIISLAEQIGIRNSRLIRGDYVISFADQILCREFPDVIGYAYSHYDNHAHDYESESPEAMIWTWAIGNHRTLIGCEIPYRAMLPVGIEGLLVSCRALSVDFDGHNQLRMQRDMQRIGEAAGIAAAMSSKLGMNPRDIDVKLLQRKLSESLALQDPENGYHNRDWKPAELFSNNNQKMLTEGKDVGSVAWIARTATDENSLLEMMDSADKKDSVCAALLLGAAGKKAAMGKLIECIKEKADISADRLNRCVSLWKPALAVAGWNKCAEALPVIEEILEDKNSDQSALILALDALGNIGNRKSVAAIKKMLLRDDLPSTQTFRRSVGNMAAVTENSLWKIELAAAANLAKLGSPDKKIAEKYLDDERLLVRRCAQNALKSME